MTPATRSMALVASAAAVASADSRSQVTPVQKVVQMMEDMLAKGTKEKRDEQVQFATYKQFCDNTSAEKKQAIVEANEQMKVLAADIEKYQAIVEKMSDEIDQHREDMATAKAEQKAATKERQMEKSDYDALHTDYSESIDALGRAVNVLKDQDYDRQQAKASLTQVSALKLMPEETRTAISEFLQDKQVPDYVPEGAPSAHGYQFQSGGIVEMMKKLEDEFIAERTQIEKDEMSAVQAYEVLMQDLETQIEQATADVNEKSEAKAKALENKATAEGDLTDTTSARDADKAYLADLTATCDQKANDFESRQALRAEELEAIKKAIEIVSSQALSGAADAHLPSFLQRRTARSLASLFMSRRSVGPEASAIEFLQQRSRELSSPVLMSLVTVAATGPFDKVKKMINDLIVRLIEEATEEASHKGWCDKELSTNENTRKEKTDAVETLHAEIDQLEASIAQLKEEVTVLTKEVAEIDQAVAEATKLRQEEKAKNTQTIEDAQEAQAAVEQALAVLKEFYAKASQATAFLQRSKQQPQAPDIFEKPYRGMGGESSGVVGMLEVIESDFARLETETKSEEAVAQKQYDSFISDSKVDKESKNSDIDHKTAKSEDEAAFLITKKEDLEGTQQELDTALTYYDKLKPSCVDADVSYEDKVARRKEEIQSLKEALRILNGEALA